MNIVIPMAGPDTAFQKAGYTFPKSLIEVRGRPVIQHVYEALRGLRGARFIFVVRREEAARHHLRQVLQLLVPDCAVIVADNYTAGAPCSVLLAVDRIDNDEELIVTNGDQIVRADWDAVMADFRSRKLDGGTLVFESVHPRWSYVRVNEEELVVEAAEKRPISRHATAGFYYFRKGSDFVRGAMAMIRKDANVGGSFYVCPVFNELLLDQKRVGIFQIPAAAYISLATPQGVEAYAKAADDGKGLTA